MASSSGHGDSIDNGRPASMASSECPICKDVFKLPTMLHCGHSVCSACANGLRARNGSRVSCPVCRRHSNLGVGDLPINYALQDLIEQTRSIYEHGTCGGCKRQLPNCKLFVIAKSDGKPIAQCCRCVNSCRFGQLLRLSEYKTQEAGLEEHKNRLQPLEEEFAIWEKQIQNSKSLIDLRIASMTDAAGEVHRELLRVKNELGASSLPTDFEELDAFEKASARHRMALDRLVILHSDARNKVNNLTDIAQKFDLLLRNGWVISRPASAEGSMPPLETPVPTSPRALDNRHPPSTVSGIVSPGNEGTVSGIGSAEDQARNATYHRLAQRLLNGPPVRTQYQGRVRITINRRQP